MKKLKLKPLDCNTCGESPELKEGCYGSCPGMVYEIICLKCDYGIEDQSLIAANYLWNDYQRDSHYKTKEQNDSKKWVDMFKQFII